MSVTMPATSLAMTYISNSMACYDKCLDPLYLNYRVVPGIDFNMQTQFNSTAPVALPCNVLPAAKTYRDEALRN